MQPFWEEKVVAENMNNINATYKVTPKKETNVKICVLNKSMLVPSYYTLDSCNWNIKVEFTHSKKQITKTVEINLWRKKIMRKKDVQPEKRVMMNFTPGEIQMFDRNEDTEGVKKEKESEKIESSIEKQHKEKGVWPKGFDKIFVKDCSEYRETEDEVWSSNKRLSRIKSIKY